MKRTVRIWLVAPLLCVVSGQPGAAVSLATSDQITLDLALAELESTLRSDLPRLRWMAFDGLSQYHCREETEVPQCTQLLSQAASDPDWEVRLRNLTGLFRYQIAHRLHVTRAAAHDKVDHVRRAAARLLADDPKEWHAGLLEELVESPDRIVHEHAAAALVRLGRTDYSRVLDDTLYDGSDEEVLEAARHTVALRLEHARKGTRLLMEMLAARDEVTRSNAIYALSDLEETHLDLASVRDLLHDPSPMVRLAMISVMPRLSSLQAQGAGALETLRLLWPKERIPQIRLEMLRAMAELERGGAVPSEVIAGTVEELLEAEAATTVRIFAMGMLACHREGYGDRLLALALDASTAPLERVLSLSSVGTCWKPKFVRSLAGLIREELDGGRHGQEIRSSAAAAIVRLFLARGTAVRTGVARARNRDRKQPQEN